VIAGWVLLLVVAAPLAAGLGNTQRTDPVNYLPAGAQSTALLHELAATPGGDMSQAVVTYGRPGGLTATDRTPIGADRAAVPSQVIHVQVSADGAAVITSAGLVLAATFTTLAVLPLVVLTETGIAVALGVLLDTCLVRCLLVPALTYDLGDRVWWPRRPPTTTRRPKPPCAGDARPRLDAYAH